MHTNAKHDRSLICLHAFAYSFGHVKTSSIYKKKTQMVTLENRTQLSTEHCWLLPHVQPKATARKWWVDRALYNHSLLFENRGCQNLQPWCTTWKQQMDKLIHMGHSHNYYVVWPPSHTTMRSIIHRHKCHNVLQYQASAMHHACSYFGHKVSCECLHRSPVRMTCTDPLHKTNQWLVHTK